MKANENGDIIVQSRSGFSTICFPDLAKSLPSDSNEPNVYYFEVSLLRNEAAKEHIIQVGLGAMITTTGPDEEQVVAEYFAVEEEENDGVGDVPLSWAYNWTKHILHLEGTDKEVETEVEQSVTPEDPDTVSSETLGVLLQCTESETTMQLVGADGEITTTALDLKQLGEQGKQYSVFPAISAEFGVEYRVNVGQTPFVMWPFDTKQLSDKLGGQVDCVSPFLHLLEDSPEALVEAQDSEEDAPQVETKLKDEKDSHSEEEEPSEPPPKQTVVYESIDLDTVNSSTDLSRFGMDCLKHNLRIRGMKCGGSLHQRCERLLAVKGLAPGEIPNYLLAKRKGS